MKDTEAPESRQHSLSVRRREALRRIVAFLFPVVPLAAAASLWLRHAAAPAGRSWLAAGHAILLALVALRLLLDARPRWARPSDRDAPAGRPAALLSVLTAVAAASGLLDALRPARAGPLLHATASLTMDLLATVLVVDGLLRAVRAAVERLDIRPPLLVVGTFALLTILGTALLLSPRATLPGHRIAFLDALFTATSATCVTGLVVFDTGGAASPLSDFGRAVVLGLIQIGGLGIMTCVAFFAEILGRRLGLRQQVTLGQLVSGNVGEIRRTLGFILAFTLITEASGALLLWAAAGDSLGGLSGAVFHAVSAFCNAGFALHPDSLASWRGDAFVNAVIMALIVAGGLGFLAARDIVLWIRSRIGRPAAAQRHRFSLHTRLVLAMSAVLTLSGATLVFLLEREGALAGLGPGEAILGALFQSVTTRTAGFATVDTGALRPATLFALIPLMLIGASPGSTGGGMKTSTFAIFILAVIAFLRGRFDVGTRRRMIPQATVTQALLILCAYGLLSLLVAFLLLVSERQPPLPLVFEAASALGTVGLSAGVTPLLGDTGRCIIVAAMFLGRIGPVTLVLALVRRGESARYELPSENVLIG